GFVGCEATEIQRVSVEFYLRRLSGGLVSGFSKRFGLHRIDATRGDDDVVYVEAFTGKVMHDKAIVGDQTIELHAGYSFGQQAVTDVVVCVEMTHVAQQSVAEHQQGGSQENPFRATPAYG